jgi:hypothetical protein
MDEQLRCHHGAWFGMLKNAYRPEVRRVAGLSGVTTSGALTMIVTPVHEKGRVRLAANPACFRPLKVRLSY